MYVSLLTIEHGSIPMHFDICVDWYIQTHPGSDRREAEQRLRQKDYVIKGMCLLIEGERELEVTGTLVFHRSFRQMLRQRKLIPA